MGHSKWGDRNGESGGSLLGLRGSVKTLSITLLNTTRTTIAVESSSEENFLVPVWKKAFFANTNSCIIQTLYHQGRQVTKTASQ